MRHIAGISLFLLLLAAPSAASADRAIAKIDLSAQRMTVYVNGAKRYTWRVSTARRGYRTPLGSYRAKWLSRYHRSSRYNNAPMPYSIFFHYGYAVHGTDQIKQLGRPVSHGCVRLHPSNAARLFALVKRFGLRNSRIVVTR